MSAPKTDLEKQEARHKGPLTGMRLVVLFALILLAGLTIFVALSGEEPEGAERQIDSRTGEVVGGEGPVDTTVDPVTGPTGTGEPSGGSFEADTNPGGAGTPPAQID